MEQGRELHQLPLAELQAASPEIEEDVTRWLDPEQCVKRRELPGGTGPGAVRKQLEKAREELGS